MAIRSLRLRVFLGLAFGMAALLVFGLLIGAPDQRPRPPPTDSGASPPPLPRPPRRVPPRARSNLIKASRFRLLTLDATGMKSALAKAPVEAMRRTAAGTPIILHLPAPDGSFQRFEVEEASIMEPKLQAEFPDFRTYVGRGIDDPQASARISVTALGFNAQVLTPSGAWYVDPFYHLEQDLYMSYSKRDAVRSSDVWTCLTPAGGLHARAARAAAVNSLPPQTDAGPIGATLRTYRLAVAATGEYTAYFGGTVSQGMAAIVVAVNRVVGVYEKEIAVRMVLVANNAAIVYTNASTDPYNNTNPDTILGQNQTNLDSVIGSANYDIGHVFSTGSGGLADKGVVCYAPYKAEGTTGLRNPVGDPFYIDYVAHEMGHQFGADHAFESESGLCSGNRNKATAYQPGGGTTIMDYAGICDADDLQDNDDPYFHAVSFNEIVTYTNFNDGNGCPQRTTTGNQPPSVTPPASGAWIPNGTPFALTASGSDPDGDALTWCWEQFDLTNRDTGTSLSSPDTGVGPLFRSFPPASSPTRYFPKLSATLNNSASVGEKLPSYTGSATRVLNFRVTARDNRAGGGGVTQAATSVNVATAAGPFVVTSQNTPGQSFSAGVPIIVTWNVAGTTGNNINTSAVNIRFSADGGQTFPTVLAAGVANSGSATVNLPVISTLQGRLKVEPTNSIYFAVNGQLFSMAGGPTPTPTPTPTPGPGVTPTPTPTPTPTGPTATPTPTPTPNPNGPRLINLSTRARVETADNVMIGGLVIQGSGTKRVLIRALGPSLSAAGVTNVLTDPTLQIVNSAGATVASNDNWRVSSDNGAAVQATGLAPTSDNESALVLDLPAGGYTAIVRGVNGGLGVALVEAYDLQTTSAARLINLSTRAVVRTGDNVVIGGIVISGSAPKRVLFRALGPSLTAAGVSGALSDPTIEIVNAQGVRVAYNDDWSGDTDNTAGEVSAAGLAPSSQLESALVITLPPGGYTAIVRGYTSPSTGVALTGVGLIEAYELP